MYGLTQWSIWTLGWNINSKMLISILDFISSSPSLSPPTYLHNFFHPIPSHLYLHPQPPAKHPNPPLFLPSLYPITAICLLPLSCLATLHLPLQAPNNPPFNLPPLSHPLRISSSISATPYSPLSPHHLYTTSFHPIHPHLILTLTHTPPYKKQNKTKQNQHPHLL